MTVTNLTKPLFTFFNQSFFKNPKYIAALWILIALISSLKQYLRGASSYNNYLIFKNVYYHTRNQLNLYSIYPTEYFDHNHYGPVFSLVIAPFALLPDYLGLPFWNITNAIVLIFAVSQLPIKQLQFNAILWICAHELLTTLLGVQFNPMMTSIILLSFVYIEKEKDFWSAMFIILGIFIKLYGVVGLAFFLFSKHKLKFIASLFFWTGIFFILPMAISTPSFILQSYYDWFFRLMVKNSENVSLTSRQDMCLMGMVRRIFNNPAISNLPFLLGGLTLFGLQYLRISEYKQVVFRLMLLASVLIFTVIFSTGSESPTYIIAFVGVAIWFVIQPNPVLKWKIFLFVFALLLTSFSPSDLFPKFIRENYINKYALKALPCVIIWLVIIYEMLTSKFKSYQAIVTQSINS